MASPMRGWIRLLVIVALLVLAAGAAAVWMQRPALVDVVEVRYAPLVRSLRSRNGDCGFQWMPIQCEA